MNVKVFRAKSVKITLALLLSVLLCSTFLFQMIGGRSVSGLSGSDFDAGNIISDSIFYNSSSMSTSQIQSFLDSKVPVCDTNGTQPYGGTTRAAYGASRGYPAPYTCLKDYSQSVPSITNSGSDLCGGSISGGTKSAAQIIYDVSKACGINPQTLIVLLQKEQSLVTDDWPWSIQYRSATGYGCPDTAPCDSEYYGFFNQVYQAAKAFRRYEANPDSYNYKADRNNYIYYHPSLAACGGTNVFIDNQATANLYIYTPYQPNTAALNNLYGTGDGCSAYGNRNFWRMFNDWFGSTQLNYAAEMIESKLYTDPARTNETSGLTGYPAGTKLYARITAKNVGSRTWLKSTTRVGTRSPFNHASRFYDPSTWLSAARPATMSENSVQPGEEATFDFTLLLDEDNGQYTDQFQLIVEGQAWMEYRSRFDITATLDTPYRAKLVSRRVYLDQAQTAKVGNTIRPGEKLYWEVKYKNTGSVTWTNVSTKIGTVDPLNRSSSFFDPATWESASRPTLMEESSVATGQIGTFLYTSVSPGSDGFFTESLGLVVESMAWISNSHFSDVIRSSSTIDRLFGGERLLPGTELRSSGHRLIMQGDGNLVVYNPEGQATWNSGTSGGNRFIMQGDGNLVMYNSSNKAIWSSGAN